MNKPQKIRIKRTVFTTVLFILIGLGYLILFDRMHIGLPCVFYEVTGFKCPGCGITRALAALLHLDFATAWKENPFAYPIILYGAAIYGYSAWSYIRTGQYRVAIPWEGVSIFFLVLLILWGILRNFL